MDAIWTHQKRCRWPRRARPRATHRDRRPRPATAPFILAEQPHRHLSLIKVDTHSIAAAQGPDRLQCIGAMSCKSLRPPAEYSGYLLLLVEIAASNEPSHTSVKQGERRQTPYSGPRLFPPVRACAPVGKANPRLRCAGSDPYRRARQLAQMGCAGRARVGRSIRAVVAFIPAAWRH